VLLNFSSSRGLVALGEKFMSKSSVVHRVRCPSIQLRVLGLAMAIAAAVTLEKWEILFLLGI
jgi:hypothetical protein